jgi:bla regulator protein BlaR1
MIVFNAAFFYWLGQSALQACVLIVVFLLVKGLVKNRMSVRWHQALWILLLVRMVFPWGLDNALGWLHKDVQLGISTLSSMEFIVTPGHAGSFWSFVYSLSVLDLVAGLWLLVVVVLTGFVILSNLKLWRAVRTEPLLVDPKVLKTLETCKSRMGVHTLLGVVLTRQVNTPALFGFVRPRLLMPAKLVQTLSIEELEHIFLHELAHLKRHDVFVGWVMTLMQIIHWFNPLVWIGFSQLRQDREYAADGLALSVMNQGACREYGHTMLHLLENFSQSNRLPSLAGVLEQTTNIKRRIQMVVNFRQQAYKWSPVSVLAFLALVCVSLPGAGLSANSPTDPNVAAVAKSEKSHGVNKDGQPAFVPTKRVQPYYPKEAFEKKIEGFVIIEFTISDTGAVKNAKVINANPKGIFEQAALTAARQWEYKPTKKNGKAVEVPGVTIRLSFKL